MVAHFRVQPRLISLLGAQYHSIEEALKELVANAWDADATEVDISLPEPMTGDPIIVEDNGYGMTRREIEESYLNIAYNRRVRAERTPKGREVRGYRGIGKFAGLIAAARMTVTTESRGARTRLILDRAHLEGTVDDIEEADIELLEDPSIGRSGTIVTLDGIRQTFQLPTRQTLGQVLLRDFRRTNEFQVSVNGVQVAADVLAGERMDVALAIPEGRTVPCQIWFVAKGSSVADPGIIIRVGERAIGAPTFFGLERDPDIPKSLLKRFYGEVSANFLLDQVLSNWGGFVENSREYQQVRDAGRIWLKSEILRRRDAEVGQAPAAFVENYAEEIERLPEPRREQAKRALDRVFKRFYDEVPERRDAIARVVLEALESDDYWTLVQGIDAAKEGDVIRLVELLRDWGLSEIAALSHRARMRLRGIDAFERLIRDTATLELSGVHRALRENIWLLGDEYEVMTSNKTLRNIVDQMLSQKYRGDSAGQRPDLVLAGTGHRYLIVELKRPRHTLDHPDVAQALKYRDELRTYLPNGGFEVIVVGGSVSESFRGDGYYRDATKITTFWQLVKEARERMEWLVEHLDLEDDDTASPELSMAHAIVEG